jgi:undecaprenyl phosphate N,N'-diacetylbacillosamine 1-phosphate transferase
MYRNGIKQSLEVLLSVFCLLLLSWLFLLIIAAFLFTNNLPVFFKQERIGFKNTPFFLWKFRTLLPSTALPLMQRTFPLGQWLRKTNLDELPQLWNVLKGDMALIGPRPLPTAYLTRFSHTQLQRHYLRPGITGLAQVLGKNQLAWPQKFRYDVFYVQKVSFLLDLLILVKTIKFFFSPLNDCSLAEQEFGGSRN